MNFETPLKNFEKPLTQQRHVTYKRREARILRPIEDTLMDELGLTYSDLVKRGVRNLWSQRQQEKVLALWVQENSLVSQLPIMNCSKW